MNSVPEGYHPRTDGSQTTSTEYPLTCDVCHRKAWSLVGYERNWPEDQDIQVCKDCHKGWLLKERD